MPDDDEDKSREAFKKLSREALKRWLSIYGSPQWEQETAAALRMGMTEVLELNRWCDYWLRRWHEHEEKRQ